MVDSYFFSFLNNFRLPYFLPISACTFKVVGVCARVWGSVVLTIDHQVIIYA